MIERVQRRRATKMIEGLSKLGYEDKKAKKNRINIFGKKKS